MCQQIWLMRDLFNLVVSIASYVSTNRNSAVNIMLYVARSAMSALELSLGLPQLDFLVEIQAGSSITNSSWGSPMESPKADIYSTPRQNVNHTIYVC